MSTPISVTRFNYVAAKVFDTLYQNFPCQITFSVADDFNDAELDFDNKIDFIEQSILWLCNNNFLKMVTFNPRLHTYCVTLTPQALSVLNSMPESIDAKTTLGSHISNIVKGGVSNSLTSAIGYLIEAVPKLITGS